MGAAEGAWGTRLSHGAKWHFSKITNLLEDLRRKHYFLFKQTQIYSMEYEMVEWMNYIKVKCYKILYMRPATSC